MLRGQGQSFWISLNSWNSPLDLFFPLHPFIYSVYFDKIVDKPARLIIRLLFGFGSDSVFVKLNKNENKY